MKPATTLNDRERILINIIRRLYTSMLMGYRYVEGNKDVRFGSADTAKPGDLVLATTWRAPHEWVIGWYVEARGRSGAVIREIGSNRLCNYDNESFAPFLNLSPLAVLEGARYEFYQKVVEAFRRGDEYMHRFGGLDFEGDNEAVIWVREAFGGMLRDGVSQSVPYPVKITYNRKTSVKKILEAMKAAGYGTRKFDREQVPQQEGAAA